MVNNTSYFTAAKAQVLSALNAAVLYSKDFSEEEKTLMKDLLAKVEKEVATVEPMTPKTFIQWLRSFLTEVLLGEQKGLTITSLTGIILRKLNTVEISSYDSTTRGAKNDG